MAKDLDDMAYETIVARICGRPEPKHPPLDAATLLAANPLKNCPIVQIDLYCMPLPPKGTAKSDGDKGKAT